MKKAEKTRNLGGQEFGHGGLSPKDLGDPGGQQVVPGRHQVSLVPADAHNDAPSKTPVRSGN